MQKNDILRNGSRIIRILCVKENSALVIDCIKRTMPQWTDFPSLGGYEECSFTELQEITEINILDIDALSSESRKIAYERYTMIAPILSLVADIKQRSRIINWISSEREVSKQTLRNYLCLYLVYQDVAVLAPKQSIKEINLTEDEKNMRWALNKFFYTRNKNSLQTAYTMMLRAKYCDANGILLSEYPTFNQFRYFYRKTKNLQTYYISRNGLKDYQKNSRPLLGDGVQEFASHVGICMLDATICDIYLVNESGGLVGRPILVAAIDGYSSLCCGYSLLWEGGVYSLRGLMLSIIEDKQKYCEKYGIQIDKKQWDCSGYLPATLVTDMGSEFVSETFEQIAELGITIENLPAYRPELKGNVEKFFDVVQNLFKPYLKGKGVIEPDFQERGAKDYRKDACLTLEQFEKVIIRCIVYYNSQRIIENYPYTEKMIQAKIKPYASDIWKWGKSQDGANLIPVSKELLILTLFPRATGKFSRYGLTVNKMRYKHKDFTEKYLSGGTVTVAYNPEDVSCVWLIENGAYIRFELIESRYKSKNLIEVETLKESQKELVKAVKGDNTQAKIDLASYIETIASAAMKSENISTKGIRANRQKEQAKTHRDYMRGAIDE